MRAVAEVEKFGIPAVGILAEGFARQGHAIARAKGIVTPRIGTYPGVINADNEEILRQKSKDYLYPIVEAALIQAVAPLSEENLVLDPYKGSLPTATVFSGNLDQVQDFFVDHLWTDGLPVMPPTVAAVEAMLEFTPLDRGTVLGELLPEHREVTVWNVAVNAVMAGCQPKHLPLLIAAVKVIADPKFRLQDGGATPGWEPQIIISGPDLSGTYGLHSGQGAMKSTTRANSAIGRFMRLAFINLAGLRTDPGLTDKACIGMNFQIALAEDNAATHGLGWPTLREECGYSAEDTVVAVQSVMGATLPIYTGGYDPEPHLQVIAEHIAGFDGHWSFLGVMFHEWTPLLVMSPGIAQVFTRAGMSKQDVADELAKRALTKASHWVTYPHMVGIDGFNLEAMVAAGTAPAPYGESSDPDRLVPTISYPKSLAIVLAGDADRNQTRYLVNNHEHGPRIAVKVETR